MDSKNNNSTCLYSGKTLYTGPKLYQPQSRKINPEPHTTHQFDAWRRLPVVPENPIVVTQDISRVITERPERKWIKPLMVSNNHDKNSLTFIFTDIKKQITNKKNIVPETKTESINIFQQKLEKSFIAWNSMTDFILKKILELDNKYLSDNFFGFRDLLIYNIMNILLSFIIIGADTKTGKGIDNLNGPCPLILESNNNQLTVKQQIILFLKMLPTVMEQINQTNKQILKLEKNRTLYLQENNSIDLSIQIQKDELNKQIANARVVIKNKVIVSPHLTQKNDTIENLLDTKKNIENKIQNIVNKKTQLKNKINEKFSSLTDCIQFSYFMHDDWFPSLDSDLWPSFLTETKPLNY